MGATQGFKIVKEEILEGGGWGRGGGGERDENILAWSIIFASSGKQTLRHWAKKEWNKMPYRYYKKKDVNEPNNFVRDNKNILIMWL